MVTYMLESPHTAATCMESLDAIAENGGGLLGRFEFGCEAGKHTGWAVVDAESETEAKEMLPRHLRAKAKATKVKRYNERQMKAMHEM